MKLTKCKKFSGCKVKNSESNTGVRRQLSPEFECIERMCKTMRKVTFAFDGWYIDSLLRTSEFLSRPIYWRKKNHHMVHETFFLKSFRSRSTHNIYTHVFCLLFYSTAVDKLKNKRSVSLLLELNSIWNLAMILFLSLEDVRISESL